MQSHINAGSGSDITIAELDKLIDATTGLAGKIEFDESKLDCAPRKFMNSDRLN